MDEPISSCTRARKRLRDDEDTAEVDAGGRRVDLDATDSEPAIRDKTYYKEDGDCVIIVGKVLFKIHSAMLKKEVSAFSNMFESLRDNAKDQANTDKTPTILFDDADDFRALCWIIYAVPTVYMKQFKLATADIPKLVSLYLIARKYALKSHENFAHDMLHKHCATLAKDNPPAKSFDYFTKCPESRLRYLLRNVHLREQTTKDGSFTSSLQKIWMDRLRMTGESVSCALAVGEALKLRDFTAELYYLQVTRMFPVAIEGSLAYENPLDHLTPNQKATLYRGFYSLHAYWVNTKLGISEKHFAGFECSETHICRRVWKDSWEKVSSLSMTLDPLDELMEIAMEILEARIKRMKKQLKQPDEPVDGAVDATCASQFIEVMEDELRNSLADHFFGPLPAPLP